LFDWREAIPVGRRQADPSTALGMTKKEAKKKGHDPFGYAQDKLYRAAAYADGKRRNSLLFA